MINNLVLCTSFNSWRHLKKACLKADMQQKYEADTIDLWIS